MKKIAMAVGAILCVAALCLSAVTVAQSVNISNTPIVQPMQLNSRPCPICGLQGKRTGQTVSDTTKIYYIYVCPKGHVWRVPM
jgi:hypothetical protein